jgi:hypothetical protein
MRARDLRCVWLYLIVLAVIVFPVSCQSNVKIQLGIILDGSSSINQKNPQNFNIMLKGLADGIVGANFPKDGSVELTVVQIGVPAISGCGARVEITPVVITASNVNGVANTIKAIVYGNGNTPLACGFFLTADEMAKSLNFNPGLKQVINIITDGEPTSCCDIPGTYDENVCGGGADPKTSTVTARNYAINKLVMTQDKDRITCEFIGNDAKFRNWLIGNIVWPQPGKIAPPYPSDYGWVRMISSVNELEEAINEKIKTLIPPTPAKHNESVSYNNQISQNINQNVIAVRGNGRGPGGSIWLPQNAGNTANAKGQNNQIDQNINQNAEGISKNAL